MNEAISDARDLGTFVTARLDDYPLTLIEFRLYCRMARRCGSRGKFWESDRSLAKTWGVSDRTIRDAKALLRSAGLVGCTRRPGKTDQYVLTKESTWVAPGELEALRQSLRTDRRTREAKGLPPKEDTGCGPGDRGESEGGAVLGTAGCGPGDRTGAVLGTDEGTPIEGTPLRMAAEPQRKPEDSETSDLELLPEKPKRKRKRDPLFEAIVEACGWSLENLTSSERGRAAKATKELREVGADPQQVAEVAQRWRKQFPDAILAPQSLPKSWQTFTSSSNVKKSPARGIEWAW